MLWIWTYSFWGRGKRKEDGRWKVEGGGWMVDRKWWWAEDIKIW
jgi:hypothetical protein